jgi:hypothetical protein
MVMFVFLIGAHKAVVFFPTQAIWNQASEDGGIEEIGVYIGG